MAKRTRDTASAEKAARALGWDRNVEHETFFKRVRGHAVGYDSSQVRDWPALCARENIRVA